MNPEALKNITRRTFFKQAGYGVGTLALSSLLSESLLAAGPDPTTAKAPMFPARAKSVIFLFMAGAPSQLDLFDPKPTLNKFDHQPCPAELLKGEEFAFIKGVPNLLGSPYKFE